MGDTLEIQRDQPPLPDKPEHQHSQIADLWGSFMFPPPFPRLQLQERLLSGKTRAQLNRLARLAISGGASLDTLNASWWSQETLVYPDLGLAWAA